MRTDRPENIDRQSRKPEPRTRSATAMLVAHPARKRLSRCDVLPKLSRSDLTSLGSIFVKSHKVAQCNRILNVVGRSKRITSQLIFEASNKNSKAKRIETRFQ